MTIKEATATAPSSTNAPGEDVEIPLTTVVEILTEPNAQQMNHRGDAIPTITLPTTTATATQNAPILQSMEREDEDEIVVVATVTKPTPSFPVGINLRTDRNGEVFVSRLNGNGLIAQSTNLEQSMRILSVNGVSTENKTPHQLREVIAKAPDQVTIVAARTTGKQQTDSIRQKSVWLNEELARAKERELGNKERFDDNLCGNCCIDCCIYCPAGGCDPHGQHSCCQLCCLGCESGCSALDNDCDCDLLCTCCNCILGCFGCVFQVLGAVSV
ncbi:unknown protein [Seminavis robusta]|uniref:PDZ domain-containing protein n=1 Tax=Seminavis robusta TaxID=568900 RepID=A0A9N8HQI0_9STRA|nr:unknown protein [Seminavis robusta]|eukprot:Sro1444_g273320.1 n/a (272) ;mRNA; f:27864-28679